MQRTLCAPPITKPRNYSVRVRCCWAQPLIAESSIAPRTRAKCAALELAVGESFRWRNFLGIPSPLMLHPPKSPPSLPLPSPSLFTHEFGCEQMIAVLLRPDDTERLTRICVPVHRCVYFFCLSFIVLSVNYFVTLSTACLANNKNNNHNRYLRHHNPDPSAPNGVRPSAVQTFVKSTAGYCVITYLVCKESCACFVFLECCLVGHVFFFVMIFFCLYCPRSLFIVKNIKRKSIKRKNTKRKNSRSGRCLRDLLYTLRTHPSPAPPPLVPPKVT